MPKREKDQEAVSNVSEKRIRALKNLSTGLVVAAIIFAFLIAGIRLFGVQVYGVQSGSMEPAYPVGSLIYVKDADVSELRVNDVITFSMSPGVIATHRIVQIVPDENNPSIVRFRTKGDANREVDSALADETNIIGKAMFAIPKLGYVAQFIQGSPGIYVAILVCGLMIAFVFYTDSLDSKQKEQNQAQPKEDKQPSGLVTAINKLSQKVLGKDLIKAKEPPLTPGYTPPQAMQQPMQYQQPYYPQQYPAQYGQMQPGQQGYPQQPYQQYGQVPQYPQQGQWQQNYPHQGYPQQQQGYYPQQMQQPAQQTQPYYYPQGYPQQYGQPVYQQPQQAQQPTYPMPQARSNPPRRGFTDQDK